MPDPVRLLCLGGSTRPGSTSELALRVCAAAATAAGADVDLVVGRDLLFPLYDTETSERSGEVRRFTRSVADADAMIVSSPGYHGSLSGMIKNALDYVEDLREGPRTYLDGIPVGCIAVAHGWQASVTTLQSLRVTVHALRGWPSPLGVTINASTRPFDEAGTCVDEAVRRQLEIVVDQVLGF